MKLLISLLGLCISIGIFAQQTEISLYPTWMGGDLPKDGDNSFFAKREGIGYNYQEAYDKTVEQLKRAAVENTGYAETEIFIQNGKSSMTTSGKALIQMKIVDDYMVRTNDGMYHVYLLGQIARKPTTDVVLRPEVNYTDQYNPGLRALVPSWAQFYKGHNVKGSIILVAEIAFLTSGIASTLVAQNNYDNSLLTNNITERQAFNDKYTLNKNIAMYSFIGAGVIYAWNIIDAFVTKPKNKRARYAFAPMYDPSSKSFGLCLNYKF